MRDTLSKGATGLVSLAAGLAVSVANVKEWLQVAALVLGCGVSVLSAVSLAMTIQEKWQGKRVATELPEPIEPDLD